MAYLPDDILHMVCTELCHQQDLDTLFNCACFGKLLAAIAVIHLYRMQNIASIPDLDRLCKMIQGRNFRSRACRWRTILLSSLGKTLYPYCQYIRTLNLHDLENLLAKSELRDITSQVFFQNELEQFAVMTINKPRELDPVKTTNRIGEAITKKTPQLKVLIGEVPSGTLSRWIPRLPRLTLLKSSLGAATKSNGTLIRLHCPSFKGLDICDWNGRDSDQDVVASLVESNPNLLGAFKTVRDERDSDQDLAAFLNKIHPQSLKSFKTIRYGNFGPNDFRALNCHGESLIELNLHGLSSSTTPKISLLKGCTNLVSLSLAEHGAYNTDLEILHHDAFIETVVWLNECKKLRTLAFIHFFSAPALMTRIFSGKSVHLVSLENHGIGMRDTDEFYQALANQTSLQKIRLKGSMYCHSRENNILVESLSRLVNLTFLDLKTISEWLFDRHIVQLASSLPKLEVWLVNGYRLTDAIWGEFASLRSLQRLELDASMRFTAGGICGFIEKLGSGNKGLVLSMTDVAEEGSLLGEEEVLIRDMIDKKVEGRFEFTLWNDPELEMEFVW